MFAGVAGYLVRSTAFLFSRLRLPDFLCRSAQVSHLVWCSMARLGQFTHLLDRLAPWVILRRSFRWYSFRSGVWLVVSSYSLRSSGVFLTLVLATFLAGVVLVG